MAFFKRNSQNKENKMPEKKENTEEQVISVQAENKSVPPRRSFFFDKRGKGQDIIEITEEAPEIKEEQPELFGFIKENQEVSEGEIEAQNIDFKPIIAFEDKRNQVSALKNRINELSEDIESISGIFKSSQKINLAPKVKISSEQVEQDDSYKITTSKTARKFAKKAVSLAFRDFSGDEEFCWADMSSATEIFGIRYPASFDIQNADFSGKSIDHSDFSLIKGLKFSHIKDATDISGIIFPAAFDIENAQFSGKNISGCDFSAVYALKWRHIVDASDISAIKYPPTFDVANMNVTGRKLTGSDFSLVNSLQWEYIEDSTDVSGIRYPAGFNVSNIEFSGRDLSESDFSLVQSLTWENLKKAKKIRGISYPSGFDIENADFSGRDISGSDFSKVSKLTWKNISGATKISGIKYPVNFNAGESRFAKRKIHGSNFSRVESLRFNHIKDASSIQKIVYPPQFDIFDADFSDKDIDFSDFSHLVSFNWEAVRLADSRDGVLYPLSFVVPEYSLYEIQGASLIYLLRLYSKIYGDMINPPGALDNIHDLYPGMEDEKIAELIETAQNELRGENGEKVIKLKARASYVGDKLFITKLGWNLLTKEFTPEKSREILTETLEPMFKKGEKDAFESRLDMLQKQPLIIEAKKHANKEADESEIKSVSEIRFDPGIKNSEKTEKTKVVQESKAPVETENKQAKQPVVSEELPKIVTKESDLQKGGVKIKIKEEQPPEKEPVVSVPDYSPGARMTVTVEQDPEEKKREEEKKASTENLSKDELKAIRTGVMGMLLYIKRHASDEPLSFSELSSIFLKIYPDATIKDASAMAQFSSNVLSGINAEMKGKLFAFATRAEPAVKRQLLEFTFFQYQSRLTGIEDEESFKDFLKALTDTLFEDTSETEFTEFLRNHGVLKKIDADLKPHYKVIPFEQNIGRVNVYASENYPFYRTLEMVGFSHFTFEALSGSIYIEVSDNRFFDDISHLITREKEPNLKEFLVIDSQFGYLYLEKRTLADWNVDAAAVWKAAEHNMESIDYKVKYVFASLETSPYRYIQNDLTAYILQRYELLNKLSDGNDLIIGIPCREIAYIDKYSFDGIRAMLDLLQDYNCTFYVNGEPYEHPLTKDIFIYRAETALVERVNADDYILLGDTENRRKILSSVAPSSDEISEDYSKLTRPLNTDDVRCISEDEYVIQEAVYTALKLYAYCNGTYDYTVAENAMMAVFDDVYISFDAQYPAPSGNHHPDPMDHLPECAAVIARAGKKVNWFLMQAFEKMCGESQYETPSAAKIRQTIMDKVYGVNANVIWLSCGAAEDFEKRLAATKIIHEKFVENAHLYFLDTEVEMVMHTLTLIFHQYGKRYALGQVRRHIVKILPDIKFTYEQSQSAWLPEQGTNLDVEIQSLGMILRGFDPKTRDRVLDGLARAIGDADLASGGWPLLVYAKLVKSAYLSPEECINHYFASRRRMIPNINIIKALNYKDINAEFVKHSRAFESNVSSVLDVSVVSPEMPEIDIPDPLGIPEINDISNEKPELSFVPVDPNYLRNELNFVLEPSKTPISSKLKETAEFVSSVFHVSEKNFKANNDVEAELYNGILRKYEQFTTLRSLSWTCADLVYQKGKTLEDITGEEIQIAADYVESQNRMAYRSDELFPALCGTPVNQGMFIPVYQEYLFFAQTQVQNMPLASLFALQNELEKMIPVIKILFETIRLSRHDDGLPPETIFSDALRAWCALAFSCDHPVSIAEGPAFYNFEHVKRV